MVTKKTFVTTSILFLAAFSLYQINSFKNERFQSRSINYSAFINLAQNIKSNTATNSIEVSSTESNVDTNEIIKVIEKEISHKIRRTRYALQTIREEEKNSKKHVAVETKKSIEIKKQIEVAKTTIEEDLSAYEINNTELVSLYALSVEEMAFNKFEATKLVSTYGEMADEVAVTQASTTPIKIENDEIVTTHTVPEKNEEVIAEVSSKEEEEMVMFDYSDKALPAEVEKSMDKKLYERPISKTVQRAISREIVETPTKLQAPAAPILAKNTAKIDDESIDLDAPENTVYDYSQETKTTKAESIAEATEANAFTTPVADAQFVLRAREINLNTQKSSQVRAFEFVPDYDRADRRDDQSGGEIGFGYSLSGEMNTQTGVVIARGMIPTRVELNLSAQAIFEVPLINEAGIQKFLQKRGLAIEGNLMLLAIDPSIIDTEIDSRFAERLFFDKNFKLLSSSSGASFVLYAGVKSGNILIRYLLSNKDSSQKIVYVGDGEMYYEDAEFKNLGRETFTFTTRNVLGQKRKELIIDGNDINYFYTNITAKKKALNAYDMKIPTLASGMRKYFEFKHLNDSVFVGSSDGREIEIPSNEFIGKVLEINQVNSLDERCVVQLNLTKDVRSIVANGKNRSGEMFVETTFLDSDGAFSRDNFELAEKAFMVGDLEGQFSVKIEYSDDSTQFLKTFCSPGTYLVEQL